MGETYWAGIRIEAVPREWLILEEVDGTPYGDGKELAMRGWAERWGVVEHDAGVFHLKSAGDRVGPLSEEDAYTRAEEYNHRALGKAWDELVVAEGGVVSVHEKGGGGPVDLLVSDQRASYGIAQFYEEGQPLDELLRAAGLAFDMRDDGKEEMPGKARWWRPGMPAIRSATNAGDAGLVISRAEVSAIIASHRGDPARILALIAEWLDIPGEELAPPGAGPAAQAPTSAL